MRRITVTCRIGERGGGSLDVGGYELSAHFAAHRKLRRFEGGIYPDDTSYWQITHRPSGTWVAGNYRTRGDAMDAAQRLEGLFDWSATTEAGILASMEQSGVSAQQVKRAMH